MSSLALVEPRNQQERLEQDALSIPNQARAITVKDQSTLDAAARMLTEVIKPLRREAADVFDPIINSAHKAHKEALAGKARIEKPLIEAEDVLKRSVGGYLAEQDRLRREEEARIRQEYEARQRQAEKEAEERRREEEQALNEKIAREHAEELERQIETAEAFGDSPEVIAALCNTPEPAPVRLAPEMPVYVPAPTAALRYVAPAGVSTAQRWKAEVTSLQLLCRAIADGKVPAHYVEANMTALNGMARANKQAMNIPGVRAVADMSVSARGR